MSQLVYPLTVLPNPPPSFLRDLDSLFYAFIWSNKPDKIKRSVLINSKCNGGLNMVDLESFSKSLKCKWVKLYLNESSGSWKILFDQALRGYGGRFIFECNFSKDDVKVSNIFIQEVINAWADYNFRPPDSNVFSNQSILNNSFIKIDNNIIYSTTLRLKNVHFIRDFFDDNGNVIDYTSFTSKFHINSNFPFTFYYGIISAIPNNWKTNLRPTNDPNENIKRLSHFTTSSRCTKVTYKYFIQNKALQPTAISRWDYDSTNDYRWSEIFTLPFVAVRDCKIQYFQYRFIHRILGTNSFIFKIKRGDSPLCSFCNAEDETLDHLFWFCPITNKDH